MRDNVSQVVAEVGKVLLGKEREVQLALTCLLANGHLLIEDLPGMGKTTLAHALAKVVGLNYQRVQFTSDMLPADILGVSIFDQAASEFSFHPGPIFSQLLLADEINRTTPKTQSALLEAMEERQVTIDGDTRPLPQPFFVIATQNPQSQMGTFPLPESQLDRFLMCISLGYPDPEAEMALFKGGDSRRLIDQLPTLMTPATLLSIRQDIEKISASDSVLSYLQRLVHLTRHDSQYTHGLSPRGALGLLHCAKAWAYMQNRDYLIPEDIQAVVPSVVTHRVMADSFSEQAPMEKLLQSVDILP
ncbi:MoxR family ATPase [Gilvimarinus agarilyticus]|uniref:AAA family ATPase n=1 Tax=unclassified Gilvimarinus TaxID=2642066 RepID=UPI001C094FC3|nr:MULTISPECIES: MoxR family ATPase [unclassified Gilvimarinus]MBU2885093.1 MoxR family ATPase [Gilvimarinus agarilyticus]MDO6569990.1 MoxR family ATPase [Gilvimarinus sp. 2_MG-2023]MDO6747256.1 MoxR family ATPase [Gilvimarinus sp. 1_MG-2023]